MTRLEEAKALLGEICHELCKYISQYQKERPYVALVSRGLQQSCLIHSITDSKKGFTF